MSYQFAIVGCGAIASRHAEPIAALGSLVAVCDPDPVRLEAFVSRYQVRGYAGLEELLAREAPDVVSLCTPNGLHAAQAIRCLESGSHVLCEKPMAISVQDGIAMVEATIRTGKRLFVVKQNRHNAPVVAVKKLLDEGKLGRISGFQLNCFWNRSAGYYSGSSWRGTNAMDGGILFTQFSHFIDLLYWFLGDIEQVSGRRANYLHKGNIEFEDTGVAEIRMKTGAMGTLHYTINARGGNMEGSLTLFGEKGTVKIGGQYLNRIDFFSVAGETLPDFGQVNGANDYGHYTGSMSNHKIVYEELIKALDDPRYAVIEAKEALMSVRMIERIYSSSPFIQSDALS